jgi:hypothetical protein
MRKLLVLAGLTMAAVSARAEGIEFWAVFGQTLVSNAGLGSDLCPSGSSNTLCTSIGGTSNDVGIKDGFHFGFRGGFNTGDHVGYEMGYLYNRTTLLQNQPPGSANLGGMAYHQVAFNALYYFTGIDSKIRPFATGGVGFTNYAQPGSSGASGGGTTKLGINYGGGVKIKITQRYGIRVDVRQSTTPKPFSLPLASGWLRETELSVGGGIYF